MAVTPDTTIKILKVPIEIDNLNQLTFSNATAQYNYFNSCPKLVEDELYYQRKDNYILFPKHIDEIIEYNYVMYQNSNYSNKWFYAFITNMEYENDGCTRIYIETDVIQTWYFQIQYKASFVEREHVNDDTIGKHTIPENLDVGEVTQEGTAFTFPSLSNSITGYYVGILSSWTIDDNSTGGGQHGDQFAGVAFYDNTIYGTQLFLIHVTQANDIKNLLLFVNRTNSDSHINDIESMFIIPSGAINSSTLVSHTAYAGTPASTATQFTWYTLPYDMTPTTMTANITKPTSYTGLTLKNNKCFTYPYSYLLATNNAGSNNIYKYENFSTTTCDFELQLSISIGCSGRLVPKNYKGMIYNDDEAIPLAKYPTCAWSGDAYINWLTQNAVNMITNFAMAGAGIALSGVTLGAAGAAAGAADITSKAVIATTGGAALNAAGTIGNTIGDFIQAKLMPNISGGQATGDILWANDNINIPIRQMRAKDEYLKIIDEYFSAFGYKVNEVKVPNITGRTYWNYVKTINCNIEGDIPQNDMQKIKDIFNNGVTFWHDPTKFLDYTQNNTIVTP